MRAKLHFVLSISILLTWFCGLSQEYWKPIQTIATAAGGTASDSWSEFQLDYTLFLKALETQEVSGETVLFFPNATGKMIAFTVHETPVFHPDLSKKYPRIKSFTGINQKDQSKVRFSIAPEGLQAMLIYHQKGESSFIEPLRTAPNTYRSYSSNALKREKQFICTIDGTTARQVLNAGKLIDDQTLRTFRIAVSTTGEYTTYHGGTVAGALAAINATLTRVNEVFETDLGVRLQLIPNNDEVIFTDAATDPYNRSFNAEVQNTLTTVIGEANYDVGHLFHRDADNGNAGFIGAVCVDNEKGSAFASALIPEGDLFDLDYVAHELGHQFGARHTWSFESEGSGVQAEPASGTTIMGYAGIVAGNDVAPNGDDYFHHNSIVQISDYLETISCAQTTSLVNSPPQVAPLQDYVIPKGTAFVLEADATDADGDLLTYTWEQIDNGVVTASTFGPENFSGANFRSLPPTVRPERYFPRLERVLSGELEQVNPIENDAWETVSNVQRDLNFAVTVRDNNTEGGQVVSDSLRVRVTNIAGPFTITSQSTAGTFMAGSMQTVQWEVAGTNQSPVNAATVSIYLSLDGGASFPILLAAGEPNDGNATIQLPGTATTQGRIMIRATDNIFFAVNAADFAIQDSSVVLNFEQVNYSVCKPDEVVIPFVFETYGGFSETLDLSLNAPGGISGSFSQPSVSGNGTSIDLTIGELADVAVGSYPLEIIATNGALAFSATVTLTVLEGVFDTVDLALPEDGATGTVTHPQFVWMAQANSTQYDIEIATDSSFSTIVENASVATNTYQSNSLLEATTYYWRVRPSNSCGQGAFSAPFSFTTGTISCAAISSNEVPIPIAADGTPTVQSRIFVPQDLAIADVKVNLDVSHTFLEDLVIRLISPSGTKVVLLSRNCGSTNNILAVFDDEGDAISCGGNPSISGQVQSLESLSTFTGESSLGEWILEISDTVPSDGGTLNGFSLELCLQGSFRPDEDEDGVFDDGDDLCLGTPIGVMVDATGCPLPNFPENNFAITVQNEACALFNDGVIAVAALDTAINYTANLQGNGMVVSSDFSASTAFEDLPIGSYSLCITGSDGITEYQQACFDISVITEAPLSVVADLNNESQQLTLQLSGGAPYSITLNGIPSQTEETEVILDLRKGLNTIAVATDFECQGLYEATFFIGNAPRVFPNPVSSLITVTSVFQSGAAIVRLHSADGRLVLQQVKAIAGNAFEMDLSALPSGLYYLVIEVNGSVQATKVLKQ